MNAEKNTTKQNTQLERRQKININKYKHKHTNTLTHRN